MVRERVDEVRTRLDIALAVRHVTEAPLATPHPNERGSPGGLRTENR